MQCGPNTFLDSKKELGPIFSLELVLQSSSTSIGAKLTKYGTMILQLFSKKLLICGFLKFIILIVLFCSKMWNANLGKQCESSSLAGVSNNCTKKQEDRLVGPAFDLVSYNGQEKFLCPGCAITERVRIFTLAYPNSVYIGRKSMFRPLAPCRI